MEQPRLACRRLECPQTDTRNHETEHNDAQATAWRRRYT